MVLFIRFMSLKVEETEDPPMVETTASYQYSLELDILIDEVRKFIDRFQHPDFTDHAWLNRMCSIGEELAGRLSGLASAFGERNIAAYNLSNV